MRRPIADLEEKREPRGTSPYPEPSTGEKRNEAKLIALEVVGWADNPIPLLRPKGAECAAVLAPVKGKPPLTRRWPSATLDHRCARWPVRCAAREQRDGRRSNKGMHVGRLNQWLGRSPHPIPRRRKIDVDECRDREADMMRFEPHGFAALAPTPAGAGPIPRCPRCTPHRPRWPWGNEGGNRRERFDLKLIHRQH
jgi:hypothetical protein